MKLTMTNFSIRRPWVIMAIVGLAVIIAGIQFPRVNFDNDPENMLSEDEHVRVFHNEVKQRYNLYDFVIVGVVNDEHPDGVFNVETLNRVYKLTYELLNLHQTDAGKPAVREWHGPDQPPTVKEMDLQPESIFKRVLNVAFRHDPEHLFREDGSSVIIGPEVISPSVVDNIKQADLGALKIEYLMEQPPKTAAEARRIRDDAMSNPLYKGTMVAADGKALALYIPITEKHFSHNVANLVRELTKDWDGKDKVHITGLPVAEDTFGVEMLVQMATSAPLAGLTIFVLLLIFFRKLNLIIAPMAVALVSVVAAMGLLIGLGFDVHIMSSMIAIFLMPIAVTDSVHMLSEFFDTYQKFQDKAKTVKHVVGHLFTPMLYTSLTTVAGFGSLAFTPIPPVRVFGLHVAFGVALAWVLTVTFIPAYIMIFVSEKSLQDFGTRHAGDTHKKRSALMGWLERVGGFTYTRFKLILGVTLLVIAVSIFGISRIQINDNPVKWFTETHEIRVADKVLNEHFGGTYTAYLTLAPATTDAMSCREKLDYFRAAVERDIKPKMPRDAARLQAKFDEAEQLFGNLVSCSPETCFAQLIQLADKLDKERSASWNALGDEINYVDPDGLTQAELLEAVRRTAGADPADVKRLVSLLASVKDKTGGELLDAAIAVWDKNKQASIRDYLENVHIELTYPMKRPEVLRYIEDLQRHLAEQPRFAAAGPIVGKTSSVVDALKKANYELNFVEGRPERNERFRSIPPTGKAAGQVFVQLEGMKKKDSLFHLVTKDYRQANLWVQLKSGDNKDMEAVVREVERYLAAKPPPANLKAEWAGLTYLNVVWQDKMVSGMLSSLLSSFVVVLIMMMVLFRSPWFGVLSMIPLTVTITFIYGLIGLVGKDYDMPVAVLSSLTLGLSVDFAIHFLERTREMVKEHGSWQVASRVMFAEPAAAITRNAVVISVGFLPLLIAPLVPYKTVGFFLATIMAVSGAGTLLILPALVTLFQKHLFKNEMNDNEENAS